MPRIDFQAQYGSCEIKSNGGPFSNYTIKKPGKQKLRISPLVPYNKVGQTRPPAPEPTKSCILRHPKNCCILLHFVASHELGSAESEQGVGVYLSNRYFRIVR